MIGDVGGRASPSGRAARLDDHGMDLGRGNDAQRSLDLEELARVIDCLHLGGVGDHAGLAIPDEGIRRYAVPQPVADVDELLQTLVALVVIDQLVVAVIRVVGFTLRGDHVEGDTAVRDVVQRVEQPRGVKRVHEGRGVSQPETKVMRHA